MDIAAGRDIAPRPEPYAPVDSFDPDNDATSLPYDAWGMAIFLPLGLPLSEDTHTTNIVRFVMFHLPNYVLLAVTIVVQLTMLKHLREVAISADNDGEVCLDVGFKLQVACILVLVGSILSTELKWAVDVGKWLLRVPRYDDARHEAIWSDRKRRVSNAEWAKPLMIKRLRHAGDVRVVAATGLSLKYKMACIVAIVVPKSVLGFFVAHFSAGFILSADNVEDIVLNGVATLFILEVDDVLVRLSMPRTLREAFEAIPPLQRDPAFANEFESLTNALGTYPIMVLTGLLCAVEYSYWCQIMTAGASATNLIAICGGIVGLGVLTCGLCCFCCKEEVEGRRRSQESE
jgi:hypothetical protein